MKVSKKQSVIAGFAALLVLAAVAWFFPAATSQSTAANASIASRIETLSPDMFTGKTREAYQAAKDAPEVLEQLACYCGCAHANGHENNLFCFKDRHAAG
jgi:hypothetical protein